MKTIILPIQGGITVDFERGEGGDISSIMKNTDDEDDIEYNAAIDGIESLILAHACAGVDIESAAYIEGIQTAVEACANNL